MGVTTSSTVAATYEPIATQTLGSAASSVTFGSGGTLTQAYTDLVLIVNSSKTTAGVGNIYLRFNVGSGGTYSDTLLYGTGSSAGSGRHTNGTYGLVGDQSNTISTTICQIFNYANSNIFKTTLTRYNDTSDVVLTSVMLWQITNAITSVEVSVPGANFSAGSTFTLYGIKGA